MWSPQPHKASQLTTQIPFHGSSLCFWGPKANDMFFIKKKDISYSMAFRRASDMVARLHWAWHFRGADHEPIVFHQIQTCPPRPYKGHTPNLLRVFLMAFAMEPYTQSKKRTCGSGLLATVFLSFPPVAKQHAAGCARAISAWLSQTRMEFSLFCRRVYSVIWSQGRWKNVLLYLILARAV